LHSVVKDILGLDEEIRVLKQLYHLLVEIEMSATHEATNEKRRTSIGSCLKSKTESIKCEKWRAKTVMQRSMISLHRKRRANGRMKGAVCLLIFSAVERNQRQGEKRRK